MSSISSGMAGLDGCHVRRVLRARFEADVECRRVVYLLSDRVAFEVKTEGRNAEGKKEEWTRNYFVDMGK